MDDDENIIKNIMGTMIVAHVFVDGEREGRETKRPMSTTKIVGYSKIDCPVVSCR